MEMLQLRYFYESAKNESFAKTAKKYMVPTTSVSATVKRLETELGHKLFDRSGNRISLNAKGKQFLETVRHIFSELDTAVLSLGDDDKPRTVRIYAGSLRSVALYRVMRYRKAHPNINFVIDLNFDETDFEKYDIVFYPESPEKFSQWESFVYKQYQVKVEVTEENPLSERKLTLLSLKNQPFVSTGRTNPIYKTFISACERQGFTPNFVLECNDYTCIDRALRANVGLGVTLSTEASMGSTGMRHLNIVDFNERLNFCIYYKKTYGEIEKIVEYLKTGTV